MINSQTIKLKLDMSMWVRLCGSTYISIQNYGTRPNQAHINEGLGRPNTNSKDLSSWSASTKEHGPY